MLQYLITTTFLHELQEVTMALTCDNVFSGISMVNQFYSWPRIKYIVWGNIYRLQVMDVTYTIQKYIGFVYDQLIYFLSTTWWQLLVESFIWSVKQRSYLQNRQRSRIENQMNLEINIRIYGLVTSNLVKSCKS